MEAKETSADAANRKPERRPGHYYPPGPDGEFVELEDHAGQGLGCGRWIQEGDLWALELLAP